MTVKPVEAIQKLVEGGKQIDSKVLKTAEGIVSKISPKLAATLVKIDHNAKEIYMGVFRGVAGNLKLGSAAKE